MKTYEIEQIETAVIPWKGRAESEQAALDAMAREAGYRDYAHACEDTSSDGVEVRGVADADGSDPLLPQCQRNPACFRANGHSGGCWRE